MRLNCLKSSTSHVFPEVAKFEIALSGGSTDIMPLDQFFSAGEITVVRVPARLDVIGGIADYSGANVCEGTLENGVALGIQLRQDEQIHIRSLNTPSDTTIADFNCQLNDFFEQDELKSYAEIRTFLTKKTKTSWAAYVAGALFTLLKEKKLGQLKSGLNIALCSEVAIGVGVASSATIEVAALQGLNLLLGLQLTGQDLGRLGQLTENKVVGAPCGIMDQMTVAVGKQDCLTHILCQPDIVKGEVPIPEGWGFCGINSNVKHSVAGPNYTNVRIGAFMGRKIISAQMQASGILPEGQLLDYLCNITPDEFEATYRNNLPEQMSGAEFLKKYGELADTATKIDPEVMYPVRTRTAHPIYENDRVLKFIELLYKSAKTPSDGYMKQLGRLMLAAHDSYARNCELSCPEVDELVELVKQEGKTRSVYGAKITGGGSGGTVAVFGDKKNLPEVMDVVAEKYLESTGIKADVFWGSSPGAVQYGSRVYRLTD